MSVRFYSSDKMNDSLDPTRPHPRFLENFGKEADDLLSESRLSCLLGEVFDILL